MNYLIGVLLALASVLLALVVGFDRRTFYATMLIVVATYFVLFAVMSGVMRPVVLESAVMALFIVLAAVGYRRGEWIVAAGLAAHGLSDFVHGAVIANPGTPSWWPGFCASYDIAAAIALMWIIRPASQMRAQGVTT
ncbi:MAG TPA: hypothetical protein VFI52_15035 [Gemmatimonadaceae bacterium]|nr:hypothetical protein [Gemmatimonadaceae bacterium]